MKNIFAVFGILLLLLLSACSYAGDSKQSLDANKTQKPGAPTISDLATSKLKNLTLEEKVAQLFIVVPERLVEGQGNITATGPATKAAFDKRPVGGIIYMGNNIVSPDQTKSMLKNIQDFSYERIALPPFLCIDEEGGVVARVANNANFNVKRFERMSTIGARKSYDEAINVGATIGAYLSSLGFNVDFAPVADVLTNPQNTVVKGRAFGNEPETVRTMAAGVSKGLRSAGVLSSYKHFPGHGDTAADTHEGHAFTNKTKADLMNCELVPFIDAIKNNEPFIMVGHISFPNIIGDNTPASLSKVIITDLLRNELGYKGIIITDALNMGAIANQYSSTQACIKAFDAGVDVLLMPNNFNEAYLGMLNAVKEGRISEQRLNESVLRILLVKMELAKKQGKI